MATYYVSATTGNDSNNGESVATAKATIGAGENLATSAGDIVYIAPGTYRETITHGYSGTSGNRIYFIGDPDCEIFGNAVAPGVIRITAAAAVTELADDTYNLRIIQSNGKDYITWKNVHVDGGTGGITAYNDNNISYGFYATNESDAMEAINCMAQSLYGGYYRMDTCKRCVSWLCTQYGFYQGRLTIDCFALGAFTAFYQVNAPTNCIADSTYNGYYYCDNVINCLAKAFIGFRGYNGDYIYESMGIGCYYSFYGGTNTNASQNGTTSGSYSLAARYTTYYGKMHGIGFGTAYNHWINGRDPIIGRNGSTDMQGDGLVYEQKGLVLWSINDAQNMIKGFFPSLYSKPIQGCTITDLDQQANAGGTDILGNPRKMGSTLGMFMEGGGFTTSSRDIGPFELSNVEITGSYSGSSPAFNISDEGIFRIPIAVSASTAITASIHVKHNSGSVGAGLGGIKKPKFQLRYSETNVSASNFSTHFLENSARKYLSGSALIIQSVRSTADNENWQKLTVSHSVEKNRELELLFINDMSGSTTSSFSHLEIT